MEITNEANSLHLEKIIFLSSIIAIKSLVCSLKLDVEFQLQNMLLCICRGREKKPGINIFTSQRFFINYISKRNCSRILGDV